MPEKTKYLKGQLLLDSGELHGSFFQRTVLLICQHNAEGAFGLVLNRATGNKVGEAIVADLPDTLEGKPALSRRPGATHGVELSAFGQLHPRRHRAAESEPGPFAGFAASRLANRFRPAKKVKLFAGYAGWSAGQLEERNEAQSLADASGLVGTHLRHAARKNSGRLVLRRKGGWRNKLLAQSPEDLVVELNPPVTSHGGKPMASFTAEYSG